MSEILPLISGERLQFVLTYYDHEGAVREWLSALWQAGFAHGAQLVDLIGSPRNGKSGRVDNVQQAREILKSLTDAQWIRRSERAQPTVGQVFFDSGGWYTGKNKDNAAFYAEVFGYSPCTASLEAIIYRYEPHMTDGERARVLALLRAGALIDVRGGYRLEEFAAIFEAIRGRLGRAP